MGINIYRRTCLVTSLVAAAMCTYALASPTSGMERWQKILLMTSAAVAVAFTGAGQTNWPRPQVGALICAAGATILCAAATWNVFHFLTSLNINTSQAGTNTALAVATAALAAAGTGVHR